ncbi:hypothetical protein EVAR_67560_1 [Eumeta japonica]|uniref:Uncharacterized protein n=1 Tax=Eumeta variegata TaxID=151549 RepID=A0A4C1ZKE1_EUMVA|nr:hypothetical protein EVAR_67560_1 [Eumeta japonica]
MSDRYSLQNRHKEFGPPFTVHSCEPASKNQKNPLQSVNLNLHVAPAPHEYAAAGRGRARLFLRIQRNFTNELTFESPFRFSNSFVSPRLLRVGGHSRLDLRFAQLKNRHFKVDDGFLLGVHAHEVSRAARRGYVLEVHVPNSDPYFLLMFDREVGVN